MDFRELVGLILSRTIARTHLYVGYGHSYIDMSLCFLLADSAMECAKHQSPNDGDATYRWPRPSDRMMAWQPCRS
jgi:hypothetical protein